MFKASKSEVTVPEIGFFNSQNDSNIITISCLPNERCTALFLKISSLDLKTMSLHFSMGIEDSLEYEVSLKCTYSDSLSNIETSEKLTSLYSGNIATDVSNYQKFSAHDIQQNIKTIWNDSFTAAISQYYNMDIKKSSISNFNFSLNKLMVIALIIAVASIMGKYVIHKTSSTEQTILGELSNYPDSNSDKQDETLEEFGLEKPSQANTN